MPPEDDLSRRSPEPEPGSGGRAAGAVMRAAAAEAEWRALAESGDARALRAHLARYPDTPNWAAARARLASLEWAAIGRRAPSEAYQRFLDEFWDSVEAPLALQARDAAMRRDAARRGAAAAAGPLRLDSLPRDPAARLPASPGSARLARPHGPARAAPPEMSIGMITLFGVGVVIAISALIPLVGVVAFTLLRVLVDGLGPAIAAMVAFLHGVPTLF